MLFSTVLSLRLFSCLKHQSRIGNILGEKNIIQNPCLQQSIYVVYGCHSSDIYRYHSDIKPLVQLMIFKFNVNLHICIIRCIIDFHFQLIFQQQKNNKEQGIRHPPIPSIHSSNHLSLSLSLSHFLQLIS